MEDQFLWFELPHCSEKSGIASPEGKVILHICIESLADLRLSIRLVDCFATCCISPESAPGCVFLSC